MMSFPKIERICAFFFDRDKVIEREARRGISFFPACTPIPTRNTKIEETKEERTSRIHREYNEITFPRRKISN
jgi:hypothetical protein